MSVPAAGAVWPGADRSVFLPASGPSIGRAVEEHQAEFFCFIFFRDVPADVVHIGVLGVKRNKRDILPEKRLPILLRDKIATGRFENHIVVCIIADLDPVGVAAAHHNVVLRAVPRLKEGQDRGSQAVGGNDLQVRECPGRLPVAINRLALVWQNVQRVAHGEVRVRAVSLTRVKGFPAAVFIFRNAAEEEMGVAHIHAGIRAIHQQGAGDLAPFAFRVRRSILGAEHRLAGGDRKL